MANNLVGRFPPSIANLTNLYQLDIRYNELTGPIPSNVRGLQNLKILSLSNNLLFGTLPSCLFHHPNLTELDLSNNQFTGQMVDFQENSWLSELTLPYNQLHGPIPKSISTLRNLAVLDLSSNNLSGIVEPNMFLNLTTLENLLLSDNSLLRRTSDNNGNISFHNLSYLQLTYCGIKEFPDFLRNSKNLEVLQLSKNNIQRILSWFTSMALDSLRYLNLSHNSLSSMIQFQPTWKSLLGLGFQWNQLRGTLPLSICNLEALRVVDLSNNKLSGAIPQCFGHFSRELMVLNLKNNDLQGSIAMTFATSSKLRNLDFIGNHLEGSLPRSLANCEYLEVLDIGNNNINDTFPVWLENLKELQVLILKSNRFFGPIGDILKTGNHFGKLKVIDISNNEFSGSLPTRLLNSLRIVLKGLEIELPAILTTLTSIDVSNNSFSGEIPQVIGNLVVPKLLNLSHNRFFGHIPPTLLNLACLLQSNPGRDSKSAYIAHITCILKSITESTRGANPSGSPI
ncbi:hypothetical protein ACH5RR_009526 [Cinchona calisaya]|uniref:Toll-like receptor 3 n=1 Tax=Cinchona calisaya TaxID=153742 RepID=A0ABD3AEM8_9GENT